MLCGGVFILHSLIAIIIFGLPIFIIIQGAIIYGMIKGEMSTFYLLEIFFNILAIALLFLSYNLNFKMYLHLKNKNHKYLDKLTDMTEIPFISKQMPEYTRYNPYAFFSFILHLNEKDKKLKFYKIVILSSMILFIVSMVFLILAL